HVNQRTPSHGNGTGPGFGFTPASQPWQQNTSEAAGVDVAAQQADPRSLWNLYKSLIALRRNHAPLQGGDAKYILADGGGAGVLALLRGGATGGRGLLPPHLLPAAPGPPPRRRPRPPPLLVRAGPAAPPPPTRSDVP